LLACLQVLEHAVCDCERRSKQLLEDALTAQQYERDARQALATTREGQASAERALQQQTQRLLAAERMRLSDLKVGWVEMLWQGQADFCVGQGGLHPQAKTRTTHFH
jgi:hypothetical protein